MAIACGAVSMIVRGTTFVIVRDTVLGLVRDVSSVHAASTPCNSEDIPLLWGGGEASCL